MGMQCCCILLNNSACEPENEHNMSPLIKISLFTGIRLMKTFDSVGEAGGSDNARSPKGHCDGQFASQYQTVQANQNQFHG